MAESAFILRVAAAEPVVGALRARLDPAAALGVPAHITVLYPFASPETIEAHHLARATGVASRSRPFAFALRTARRFAGVLYLAPEPAAPIVELIEQVAAAFPDHPPYGGRHATIVPHLTVAQGDEATLDRAAAELDAALARRGPIDARCAVLTLIENASGRWRVHREFPLGGTSEEPPVTGA